MSTELGPEDEATLAGGVEHRRVEVHIVGERCALRGAAPESYIRRLAAIVDEKMREIRKSDPNLVLHRVAMLTALNLADELEQERQKVADLRRRLAERS